MTRASLALAALLAAVLFWRTRNERQRKIAAGLAMLLALDVGRLFLRPWPVLFVAGFVAFYAVATWTVDAVLTPRGGTLAAPFVALLALSGEAYREKTTAQLALASFALALAAQVLAAFRFLSRGKYPDDAQRVALLLTASSVADLAGPWRIGSPGDLWYVQNVTSALTWLTIAGWEIRCLTRARR